MTSYDGMVRQQSHVIIICFSQKTIKLLQKNKHRTWEKQTKNKPKNKQKTNGHVPWQRNGYIDIIALTLLLPCCSNTYHVIALVF